MHTVKHQVAANQSIEGRHIQCCSVMVIALHGAQNTNFMPFHFKGLAIPYLWRGREAWAVVAEQRPPAFHLQWNGPPDISHHCGRSNYCGVRKGLHNDFHTEKVI